VYDGLYVVDRATHMPIDQVGPWFLARKLEEACVTIRELEKRSGLPLTLSIAISGSWLTSAGGEFA